MICLGMIRNATFELLATAASSYPTDLCPISHNESHNLRMGSLLLFNDNCQCESPIASNLLHYTTVSS